VSAAPFVFLCTCEMILGAGAESLHFLNQAQNVLIAARGNSAAAARRSTNIQFSGSAKRFPSFFSTKPESKNARHVELWWKIHPRSKRGYENC